MIPNQVTDKLTGLTYVDLIIQHQPHAANYQTVEEYFADTPWAPEISDADKAECIRTGEIWTIQWYPVTPVGSYTVAASTLERAIELARAVRD